MIFLEFQREPGVYFRVTVWMILQSSCLFSEVRLLSSYEAHLRNLLEAWQGNTEASQYEAGDQVSLSSFDCDIGIPINIQEESSIITF